ncbi:hypothetical protein IW261DRAFT_883365 [Armillaria novae-zelandiae]|uniref:Uncharacterized protein n=1 Tax=Armillaria novae-zelandiae TaxID=153914 RepID=A0AA39PK13_9AGAR|nr:hypothetical protein IW261DRAFT_883365 [Armillaria novae-zelandiae]
MPPIDLKASLPDATQILSVASSASNSPRTFLSLCLVFILCTTAYRMSPPLSPRAQLTRLNRDIDDMLVLLDASDHDIDRDDCCWRWGVHDWLKLVQIDAYELEICLLQTGKDSSASWSEYFLSLKNVYFGARAACKEVDTIRTDVQVEFTPFTLFVTDVFTDRTPEK